MKKFLFAGMTVLLTMGSAQAVSLNAEGADGYTNLGVGFGTETGGLAVSANWAHGEGDSDVAGLGVGFNLPLGPVMATVGGKALYLSPEYGGDGAALAVGGGLNWKLSDHFALYGDGYYAPEGLVTGGHISEYEEGNAGLRWNIIKPVSVSVGYRYVNIGGDDGRPDTKLADGPYLGVGLSF